MTERVSIDDSTLTSTMHIKTMVTSKDYLMTNQVAVIHASFKAPYSHIPPAPSMDTPSPTCHIRSFIKKKTTRGGEGVEKKKKGVSLVGWVTQGTFSFVWRSAYGAKCQQAYLHTVCLCVSPFPLHAVIRRILMERGFISV